MKKMILVSACLAGINCRYDGNSNSCPKVIELVRMGEAIPVCPEQLGGLPTPRIPAEFQNDRIINKAGKDVTSEFLKGAEESLRIAKLIGCEKAILKANSPSCGYGKIYDGTFTERLIQGNGAFAKLLKKNNIEIITENEL